LIDRFLSFYSRFRKHLHTLEVCSGVLLMVLGVLILTRHFTVLSSYLGFLNRFTL
jgi:cytochrome c-type biogenesis protein